LKPSSWKQQAAELQAIQAELRARRALEDCYYWLTECTRTQDEQDSLNPYKPFPDRRYFRPLIDVLDNEPQVWIYKSRTMMLTWLVCGWAAHIGFNNAATGVVFQSQDEDRAVHCINCVKILWENSPELLQKRWGLKKPMEKQPYNKLELANKTYFLGIPGNPDKVRSAHPTIFVMDEAAIVLRGEESLNVAVATRCPKMVILSSAYPGFMEEVFQTCSPADWPVYRNGSGNDVDAQEPVVESRG
jgi:hypothetical protein